MRADLETGNNHGVVGRVGWDDLIHLLRGQELQQASHLDLGGHLAFAQIPGHHLCPGQRVLGLPGFRLVIRGKQLQDAVLQAQRATLVLCQVSIHTVGVCLQAFIYGGIAAPYNDL